MFRLRCFLWFSCCYLLLPQMALSQYVQYTKLLGGANFTGDAGDQLGFAVAISGTTVMAGAPGANSGEGLVYVFDQNQTDATFFVSQVLEGVGAEAGDNFGAAVAMTATRLVVGANLDDLTDGVEGGSVHIFDLEADTWTHKQKIDIPDVQTNPQFGKSVDISSDGNRIIVGAFQRSNIQSNMGSAFIYEYSSGASEFQLMQEIELGDDGSEQDLFGRSVSIEGDAALVGAFADQVASATKQGSMHHFEYESNTWTKVDTIVSSDGAQDDRFGTAHDLDGTRVLVSAIFRDEPSRDAGVLYLYTRKANGLNYEDKIQASDSGTEDLFGTSLKLVGDKMVVGAPFHDVGGVDNAGAAYVFWDFYGTNEFLEYKKLISKEPVDGEGFGTAVAMDGDYIAVGAVSNMPETNPGAMYFFGPDEGSSAPSAAPSEPPSVQPTQGFAICSPDYTCYPLFNFWPFNRGPKTYMHRFKGPTNELGNSTTCEVKCIFESNYEKRLEDGWECGTCLF